MATGRVPLTALVKLTPDNVPPRVRLPVLVTVPLRVRPLTVPVPVTLVTPEAAGVCQVAAVLLVAVRTWPLLGAVAVLRPTVLVAVLRPRAAVVVPELPVMVVWSPVLVPEMVAAEGTVRSPERFNVL